MNPWAEYPVPAQRAEALYGDRLVRCFAQRPRSLRAMFTAACARAPQACVLVCEGRQVSYAQCDAIAQRLAGGLAARGVQAGARVVMFIDNRPEFVFVLLALAHLGAIAVPVGVREQRPGLAYIARQCGAIGIVADAALVERLPDASEAPAVALRVAIGGAPGCIHYDALLAHDEPVPAAADLAETDVAAILYTSGTTGNPKGAMLTHLGIVHSVMHFEACMKLGVGEVSALAVPASHVTGLIAVIATMFRVAGCTVIVPAFKAESFIALMQRERVTHTLMVPAMYNLCLLQPAFAHADLGAWRIGGYGGAPMPVSTIDAL
ncbi:MAG TPA: AMP-binding protein, partial [Burkholderiaceae bacterium]|nr:AMP-binding protein [Burkholderiaceae bacterium]